MERMSGEEACAAVRERGFSSLPVIAATGNASETDLLGYQRAGFTDVIAKPFNFRQLAEVLLRCGLR